MDFENQYSEILRNQLSRITAVELTVVVPSFNEIDNVELVIERPHAALDGIEWEVIYVHVRTKRKARDRAFELLQDAIARDGVVPPANQHIPPNKLCVSEAVWRGYCEKGCISEGSPNATRMAFNRASKKLCERGLVGKWETWCWTA